MTTRERVQAIFDLMDKKITQEECDKRIGVTFQEREQLRMKLK